MHEIINQLFKKQNLCDLYWVSSQCKNRNYKNYLFFYRLGGICLHLKTQKIAFVEKCFILDKQILAYCKTK